MQTQPTPVIELTPQVDETSGAKYYEPYQYAVVALETARPLERAYDNIWHALIGVLGEVGELADAFKRWSIYGKPLNVINVLEELGDILWYLNLYCHHKNLKLHSAQTKDNCHEFNSRADVFSQCIFALGKYSSELSDFELIEEDSYGCHPQRIVCKMMNVITVMTAQLRNKLIDDERLLISTSADPFKLTLVGKISTGETEGNVTYAPPYITLGVVMYMNVKKLAKRYPKKFTQHDALNRDIAAEALVLDASLSQHS